MVTLFQEMDAIIFEVWGGGGKSKTGKSVAVQEGNDKDLFMSNKEEAEAGFFKCSFI